MLKFAMRPLIRKLLPRVVAGGAALVGGLLVLANVLDWFRYRQAIDRIQNLSAEQLRAFGDFCRNASGATRFGRHDVPDVFRPLRPAGGAVFPGQAEARVYALGDVTVWLKVFSASENQRITWSSSDLGGPRGKLLWVRDPAAFQRLNPSGRLVTLVQERRRERVEWIVLANQVLVVQRKLLGGNDEILASAPLSPADRDALVAEVRALKAAAGGKRFWDDDVMDGVQLRIAFSSDGESGADDIVLSNAWSDVVSPIIDLVNRAGPPACPIEYRDSVLRPEPGRRHIVTVRSHREHERVFEGTTRTAWWCIWRDLLRD